MVTTPALFTVAEYDPTVGALSSLIIVPLFTATVLRIAERDAAAGGPSTHHREASR